MNTNKGSDIAAATLTRGKVNAVRSAFKSGVTPSRIARRYAGSRWGRMNGGCDMTIKAQLAELERQHKALEHEIAEALARSSTDDLKIAELSDEN